MSKGRQLLEKTIMVTASALVASVSLVGPATAAGYDVSAAQNELTAAAAVTRSVAAGGFTSTGGYLGAGQTRIELRADGRGNGLQIIRTSPEDQRTFVAAGIGSWVHIAARTRKVYAAGLAYIGKSRATYLLRADPEATLASAAVVSGADSADHLERTRYTFGSVDKANDENGQITYTFDGYRDTPAQPTTMTVRLTAGLVTEYRTSTSILAGGGVQVFDQTWSYGSQPALSLPTEEMTTTSLDLALSRSAVVLKSTVRAHARETAKVAKSLAKKAKRRTVRVSDVRRAAARIVQKHSEASRYPQDYLPTTSTSVTGGVVLHAVDPYKKKVRLAVVQAINGKVVISV